MKIAIIPARGGSKRIKNKNIVDLCGKPLINNSLQVAKQTGLFDKIHVSTDDQNIKKVVENLGYVVDFMRDPKLADDHTGITPVLRWVLQQYQLRNEYYRDVCLILPTACLIESNDLIEAYRLFCAHSGLYSILPVAAYPAPTEWAYRKTNIDLLEPLYPGKFNIRSQDLEKKYYDSGTFVWFSDKRILSDNVAGDQDFIAYPLDRYKAIDIDDPEDLEIAHIVKLGLQQYKTFKNEN
ncbi:MAG TPA: pseudaminic acid cytidylyltransferase [Gammaproteobacteria bacterium]|nr:pseudaminic acid cytidylyltransferase [Gammaproteobacteria bacterium]